MKEFYLVFAGNPYYPHGGWQDFKGYADSIEEARKIANPYMNNQKTWYEIVHVGYYEIKLVEPIKPEIK